MGVERSPLEVLMFFGYVLICAYLEGSFPLTHAGLVIFPLRNFDFEIRAEGANPEFS